MAERMPPVQCPPNVFAYQDMQALACLCCRSQRTLQSAFPEEFVLEGLPPQIMFTAIHYSLEGPGGCLQEACATNFEYFASDYASAALQAVSTYFYPTAEALPFRDDFAGNGEHPISDPTGAGEQSILCAASAVNLRIPYAGAWHMILHC